MKYALSRYVALGITAFFAADVLALDYSLSATAVPVPGSGAKIDYLGDTFEEDGWKFWVLAIGGIVLGIAAFVYPL